MAFSARRSLATNLSHHLTRRLHPSLSHLVPSHHDRREDPSPSSAPPLPAQQTPHFPSGDLRRRSRSQSLALPLHFGAHLLAHRSFSSSSSSSPGADIDPAAGVLSDPAAVQMDAAAGVLSDTATSAVPAFPAPFTGEVAAAAADSFPPVAALQYVIDAVHSFTGLNWWASIAVTTILIRTAMIPLLVNQLKSNMKLNETLRAIEPEVAAINMEMRNSTEPRSKQVRKKKLAELFRKHGVSRLKPFKNPCIHVSVFLCFSCAIWNMIEKVPSLKGGGAYWFTDLTTPDELHILPVLTAMAFVADELIVKARLVGNPLQQKMLILKRVLAVLIIPLSMSFCKAHFCYLLPWTLFAFAYRFAFRIPAVRQYLNLPPPVLRHVPAARGPTPKGPKP